MIHLGRIKGVNKNQLDKVIDDALFDLFQLEEGGIKYACIINESDKPYTVNITDQEALAFQEVALRISNKAKIKLGICVLYNDRQATLNIAKIVNADFVRIDTFVDLVDSDAGIIYPEAQKIMNYRNDIGVKEIDLFTDIHPKYKVMLEKKSLLHSANQAFELGSDGIVITGKKSGDPVNLTELKMLRNEINTKTIILGSGVTADNLIDYIDYIDGFFIGTSIKTDGKIDKEKVIELLKKHQ